MMNIKKLDDKEVIFIDQAWTDEEVRQLRTLLIKKKEKKAIKQRKRSSQVLDSHIRPSVV